MDLEKTPVMDEFAALVAKYGDVVKKVKIFLKVGGLFIDLYPPGTSQKEVLAPDYCPNCDELKRWNEQIRIKYDRILADRDALVAEIAAMKECRCGWFEKGTGCTYGGGLCPIENRVIMNCPTLQEQTNAPRPETGT